MDIKIVTGTTMLEAIDNTLATVDPDKETFIVVPDRTTLQIEEMLFDKLNLSSTFNLNVIGLGNLALRYAGGVINPLTEIDCVMYVKKAIESRKGDLGYFKSTNINFCKQIYKLISQFKSSSIKAEDINTNLVKPSLRRKFEDLKIIYREFEDLTSEREDPNELIEKFVKEIENSKLFENTNFVFVAFDSFTSKHFELIKSLIKNSKSVTIAMPAPLMEQTNAYIYEKDILDKVKKIALSLDTPVQVVSPASDFVLDKKQIRNQLFGRSKQAQPENNIRFFEGKNKRAEADFVAKVIAYEVFNGARYKDFAVAVSDLNAYQDELALAFEKNSIPYYLDLSQNASKSYCALLFKKILTLAYKNFRKNDLLFILMSPLFDFSKSEIEFVQNNFEEGGKAFYSLKNIGKLREFVQAVSDNIQEGAEKIIDYLQAEIDRLDGFDLDEKTLSIEKQVPQILKDILLSCKNVGVNASLSEMISAIDIGLETRQVSAIPSYYDQVYVGDITDSFFGKVKTLFVVGANAGVMPRVESDSSIFSDDELESAHLAKKVEPTIKMINRRARFKLFCLLCDYEKRLYISYSLVGNDDKPLARSAVVNELLEIFDKEDKIIHTLLPDDLSDGERLCLAVGKSQIGVQELMSEAFDPQVKDFLSDFAKFDLEKFKRIKPITQTAKTLGLGEAIKPTEIEKFYDCPFKVLCENILHLKDRLPKEISPLEVGSITHSVLEDYAKKYAFQPLSDAQLERMIDPILKSSFDFSSIVDGEIARIKIMQDIKRICNLVSQENAQSAFKPWLIEEPVSGTIDGKKFFGRADRVDRAGDFFRIIDYKTGRIATNLLKQLSVGKKLQLFAYAKFISEKTGLKCGGIYYFDAKAGYRAKTKLLSGLTSSQIKELQEDDKYISPQEMEQSQQEAQRLMTSASKYMQEGRFFPRPDDGSCQYCPFKSICLYDSQRGVRRLKGGER